MARRTLWQKPCSCARRRPTSVGRCRVQAVLTRALLLSQFLQRFVRRDTRPVAGAHPACKDLSPFAEEEGGRVGRLVSGIPAEPIGLSEGVIRVEQEGEMVRKLLLPRELGGVLLQFV